MAMLAAAIPMIAGTAATTAGVAGTAGMLATAAQIGGTVLSGLGAIQSFIGGNAQAKAINSAAAVAAGEERAKAQRAAETQRKQAALVSSRARAVAGASGGGSSDPTLVDIISDIGSEGEYRAMTAMYEGEDRARGIVSQGRADAYSAKQQGMQGLMKGMTSVLSSGASLFEKYGKTAAPAAAATRTYQTPFGSRQFSYFG